MTLEDGTMVKLGLTSHTRRLIVVYGTIDLCMGKPGTFTIGASCGSNCMDLIFSIAVVEGEVIWLSKRKK
eukprot:5996523-Amphidinium_carterae.2